MAADRTLPNRRSLTCGRRRIRIAPLRSGCRRIWRRICASTAATRWCVINCCASATTAGTGISVITTCWWMASASGDNPADRRHLPRRQRGSHS